MPRRMTLPSVLPASAMVGSHVRNPAGDDLGAIEEIMIDLEYGCVAYAVLTFGGFLGVGNKLFAIPWEALTWDVQAKEFVLDVDRELLKSAPGFDKDQWPDFADRTWGGEVHQFYGRSPYWR
jgi:sporulation protein YlmC with PRC-barrel domain